jgi:trehalose 6-phosphate synthase/phosphatase
LFIDKHYFRFSTENWSPVQYIYHHVSQRHLFGCYRDADVGLITPLRDGMNLVAKEFVACRVNSPGVLVLSPFAGAGRQLKEALIANPYDIGAVANALHVALGMPEAERKIRCAIHDITAYVKIKKMKMKKLYFL